MTNDIAASAVKAIPSVTVSSAWLAGFDMPHVVMTLTAIYTALQIAHFVYRLVKKEPAQGANDG